MVYIPPMPAHCFHLTPYYGLPCNQLGPIAIPGTHSDFSPPYGDTNISTDLLAHALRLVQQGPSQLSSPSLCLSVAFQGSCWGGRWRAAVLTKLNGYSLRDWRAPLGFRRSPSTVSMKRGFYPLFQHREKTRCSSRNPQWKGLRWLRKWTGSFQ